MRLSIIGAIAANGVIGRNKDLPWRLPADLKRFRELTMGHHVLMGRKTFEAIGRLLPGRKMVVITRQGSYSHEGVLVAHSPQEAVALSAGDEEVFVLGGGEIYRHLLPRADRLYLTRIHRTFEGDTRFPEYEVSDWQLISREDHEPDQTNLYPYSFLVYERKSGL